MIRSIKHSIRHAQLLLDRPGIASRVIAGYVKTLLLRKPVLRVVEFVVNYECQSKCVMCFASKNRKKGQIPLSPSEIGKIWKQAQQLGAVAAVLEGGEATLRKDLLEIITQLEGKRCICSLITNAIGLDKKDLLTLKQTGLSSICFSLDGADAPTNDRMRGFIGHFEQVMRCIDWCKEIGLNTYVAPTFYHGELLKIKKIIALALSKGAMISASTAVLSGKWAAQKDCKLDEAEWREVREILRQYPEVRFDWNINYSLKYECPGGREKICIGIYGDVYGCATNPVSFGNVRNEPLKNIWQRMHTFEPFRKRSPICLVSEDEDYIRTFIDPIADHEEHPVNIGDHPNKKAVRAAF
ncbi:MAG: radical SAM protein [Candidatus Omnitrophica bacterium]|nr:radical SAM protein [Candidatus Omnitrophota bacterium]